MALFFKLYRPTSRALIALAVDANYPIMQRKYEGLAPKEVLKEGSNIEFRLATFDGKVVVVSQLVHDMINSMRRLRRTVVRLRKASIWAGFNPPNRHMTEVPTRGLQDCYLRIALDQRAPNAQIASTHLLEDAIENLNIQFFAKAKSAAIVVDEEWIKEQLFPDMLFACADEDQQSWITGSTQAKY